MFEALYHITNPAFSSDNVESTQSLADALGKLLARDKRKKFALLSGTIFTPKSIPENVQGRLFLEETRDNAVANVYSATSLLKLFQSHEMPIGILCKKTDSIPFDKMANYGVVPLVASPDKWEIHSEGNLRFNIQPFNNVSISNAILPGKFVDVIAARNLTVSSEGRNYSGVSGEYVCWDLKKFVCHKLIMEIKKSAKSATESVPANETGKSSEVQKSVEMLSQQTPENKQSQNSNSSPPDESNKSKQQELLPRAVPERGVMQHNGTVPVDSDDVKLPIINNSEYQLNKMKTFLTDKHVASTIVDRVLVMHEEYIKSIEVRSAISWKLKQLRWSNIYCYGENNVIDFTKLSGLVSLVGKNKTGKSSVLDILVYILFDYVNRGSISDLMNRLVLGGSCWAELIFLVGSDEYFVKFLRVGSTASSSHADITLYRGGELLAKGCKAVYIHMENILGPRENFINSVLSIQDTTQFLDLTSGPQQKILESLFGLDKLKEKHDEVKSRANSLASELKKLVKPPPLPTEEDQKNVEMLVQITKEEKSCDGKYAALESEFSGLSKELEELSTARIAILEKYADAKSRLDECQRKISQPQSDQIRELRERIANIEKGCKFTWNAAVCHSCKANQQEFSRMTGYETSKDELDKLIRGNRTNESLAAERRIDDLRREVAQLEAKKLELERIHTNIRCRKQAVEPDFEKVRCDKLKIAEIKSKFADRYTGDGSLLDYEVLTTRHAKYDQRKAELESEHEIVAAYASSLDHKYGLGHIILTERAELICSRMNELLKGICAFRVKFAFTATQFAINIVQDDREFDSSLGSGYQRFVINLILRIVAANEHVFLCQSS